MKPIGILVGDDLAGQTLAAVLRKKLPHHSWTQVRKLVAARRVKLNGEVWLDSARRVKEGDTIEILPQSAAKPRLVDSIVIRHIDAHVVVVEKPAGISTVRHPSERAWSAEKRQLVPTLDDLVLRQVGGSRLRIVHRLDKETSGLLVFARTADAERELGRQFRRHTVHRKYLAIVHGTVKPQTMRSFLVRDRGDGRRGSSRIPGTGKEAITHVDVVEKLNAYTLVSCRLETGRTHQIRIHLAELGHPVCGEKVYNCGFGEPAKADTSGAFRLALHAAELGFEHPMTGEALRWEMPLPADLARLAASLRRARLPEARG